MVQEDVKNQASADTPTPDQAQDLSPEADLRRLREQLADKEAEARANYDRFLRERAELENFKKRMQREKADALRFACEPLIREILPVIDNLERAIEHGDGNGQSVIQGIQLVVKSLLEVLERHGVKRIEAVGQPFDPSRHEAMAQVAAPDQEPNRVVDEHHRGYLLHDRLLRPALVTVSGGKSGAAS